jgi:hypothetical protein
LYERIADAAEIGQDPEIRQSDRQMMKRRPVASLLKPLELAKERKLQEGGTASINDCRKIVKGSSDFECCVPIIDRLLEQTLKVAEQNESGPLHERAMESFTQLLGYRIMFAGEPRPGVADALEPVLGPVPTGKRKIEKALTMIKDFSAEHPSPEHTLLGEWKAMETRLGSLKHR